MVYSAVPIIYEGVWEFDSCQGNVWEFDGIVSEKSCQGKCILECESPFG